MHFFYYLTIIFLCLCAFFYYLTIIFLCLCAFFYYLTIIFLCLCAFFYYLTIIFLCLCAFFYYLTIIFLCLNAFFQCWAQLCPWCQRHEALSVPHGRQLPLQGAVFPQCRSPQRFWRVWPNSRRNGSRHRNIRSRWPFEYCWRMLWDYASAYQVSPVFIYIFLFIYIYYCP